MFPFKPFTCQGDCGKNRDRTCCVLFLSWEQPGLGEGQLQPQVSNSRNFQWALSTQTLLDLLEVVHQVDDFSYFLKISRKMELPKDIYDLQIHQASLWSSLWSLVMQQSWAGRGKRDGFYRAQQPGKCNRN